MGKLSEFCSEEERLANPFIKYDFFFKIGLALLSASPRALNPAHGRLSKVGDPRGSWVGEEQLSFTGR